MMAPLSKETFEVANSVADSGVSPGGGPAHPAAPGRLRSDALSLEISVKVHGSRVTEVVRGITPHTEPFEEQTSTMIVFPQGGVLRMATAVRPGQMLVLTNLKTRQDAICRVVKIRTFSNSQGYVEVEFTHRQPGYWGVNFPSDAEAAADKPAPPAPGIAEPADREKPVQDISWAPAKDLHTSTSKHAVPEAAANEVKPAAAPAPPAAPPSRPTSSFISIGSQETVQVAASATSGSARQNSPESEDVKETHAPEFSKSAAVINFPAAPTPAPPATPTMAEMRGDELRASTSAADARTEEQESSHAAPEEEFLENAFGTFAGGATVGSNRSASAEIFGTHLESGIGGAREEASPRSDQWKLIGAGIAVLALGLAGGIFYFRSHTARSAPTAVANPPAVVEQPAPTIAADQPISTPNAAAPANHVANGPSAITVTPSPVKESKAPASAEPKPSAPAKQTAPSVTPGMVSSAMKAHPVTTQRAVTAEDNAAPSLDAGPDAAAENGVISGVVSSSSNASLPPPPEPKAEVPTRVGGDVKEPRLISSILPVYPTLAQRAAVQGDVVVQTTIDKSGRVSQMKVVSGPPMLRQAALDALRRWKYEPSTLDGQPVAVQMMVTIKFRR
jgi:protein TonB